MRKELFICDHCGKEYDITSGLLDVNISGLIDFMKADLCSKCFHELNDAVYDYINLYSDMAKNNN